MTWQEEAAALWWLAARVQMHTQPWVCIPHSDCPLCPLSESELEGVHFLQQCLLQGSSGCLRTKLLWSMMLKLKWNVLLQWSRLALLGFRHVFCGSSRASCALCSHWRWSDLDGTVTLLTSSCWARLFALQKAWMPLNVLSKTQGSHLGVRKGNWTRKPRFQCYFWLCCLWAVWLWANRCTSLSFRLAPL